MALEDLFAKVFEQPAQAFTDDSSAQNVVTWTSLRHVTLLMEIENAYNTRFTNTEMASMRSLGDIRTALTKKGVDTT